ncbi:hypothetical protein METBIDRAFT_42234 [Metschnikowia bicuspidata var. bicuspidata NRRL YB-4993]|uniref:Structural maintenance of chromosomes protein n=1 Tax=Metschnikowia bicuspidata var. bicuspidata NRRL YB-4993 TaxID=869754 RepID=A0A1A0HAY6_9ASCO|nr:hypothetical protein METBIDRAFT_42234 [Metschnikowia bicuspidata var. bicuspidata NRRL YB-4993]OBA21048.1 hypothetical protein METBIDRAFT_42234 [Metschnikowia bicuspidata var. bicuspidata NRRL YB-4993]
MSQTSRQTSPQTSLALPHTSPQTSHTAPPAPQPVLQRASTPALRTEPPSQPSFLQQQVSILSPSKRRQRESLLSPDARRAEPRLVIGKLVLTDFKSYAGVQEIGPFHASFSAVVGPNGSGKSNVIDAMLFVFGFRALKMRQGRLLELIHNSAAGLAIQHCQVDIHFVHVLDDPHVPGRLAPVGRELVISRRAFRSNGSQYYVDGRASTYTDVTAYLRGQGIDLDHKRFLILQGEVELIAQMKPKAERDHDDGLLEYLEDIVGTSRYKPLIEASAARIDALNETCLEKEHRFQLVESDTGAMEDRTAEALRFLAAEAALAAKRGVRFHAAILAHRRTLAASTASARELAAQLDTERLKNRGVRDALDAAQRLKTALAAGLAALRSDVARRLKQLKAASSRGVSLEEKRRAVAGKGKKIRKTQAASEAALAASALRVATVSAESARLTAEARALELSLLAEKATLRLLRLSLTDKTSHFSAEILRLQTELEPFNDRLKAQDRALELVQSEISMLQAQARELDVRLKDESRRLVGIKADGKAKEAHLDSLARKLAHINEQIALGEEQSGGLKKALEGKRVRLASARLKTLDAGARLASVQNKNAVLVSLTKLSRSGRISGFHGRLGDLGIIDDKYDVAVSTACPALDSMVVDTVETAQACIDYLRKNRLGYANFICLNKLQNFNMAPIRTPGSAMSVKRIFDLITPQDPKFLPAFYSKLRDTLVATNLQEAKSVAYGPTRYKVVTVDGKVVDTSGTMSGGGNSSARGGMKLRSNAATQDTEFSEDDVAAMRSELQAMESEVQALDVQLHEMEVNLRKLRDLKPDTEFAIQTAQLDITSLVNEGKEVSKTIKLLLAEKESTSASSEVDTAIEAKQIELDKIIESKEHLKQQMLDSESRIALLEEKIMEAGGIELKAQNSKIDSIKQQIEIVQEKSSADLIALKKLENEIKRHTKIVSESEAELARVDEDCATIELELAENKREREELDEQAKKIQELINEKESLVEKLELHLEELTAEMNEYKSEEIELRNQLEKVQTAQRRCQKLIEEAEASLADTVVRDTNPYLEWMNDEERAEFDKSDVRELTEEEIMTVNLNEVEDEIKDLETYMSEVKVDVEILKEYGLKRKELDTRREELNESVEQRDGIKNHCEELKRKRLDEFMEGFNTISLSLKEMYQMITMGGNAELELVDSLDPFSEGILFSVMPPKKSWKNISNLSGGEKTLSSLALVFALHKYKPTPLYVMDEIDAALDFRNVSIVANYIKERTRNAQFIVISLRNNMFELAQQLVGIYKVSNMTRSISLKNEALFADEQQDHSK